MVERFAANRFGRGARGVYAALLIIGGDREDHLQAYEEVTLFAIHTNRYAMPAETDLPIWICRRPKVTLKQIWPEIKGFG